MRGSRLSSAVFGVVFASAGMTGSACSGSRDAIGWSDQVVRIEAGELPTNLLPFDINAASMVSAKSCRLSSPSRTLRQCPLARKCRRTASRRATCCW